jgi:hypothetical protein
VERPAGSAVERLAGSAGAPESGGLKSAAVRESVRHVR